jgi:hypothetical protein
MVIDDHRNVDQGSSVVRAPGSTYLTGTAVSDDGTYNVDVTR